MRLFNNNGTATAYTATTLAGTTQINIIEISSREQVLSEFSINGKKFDSNNNVDLDGVSTLSYSKMNEETLTEERHPKTGKPIYVKTIDFGAFPNATTKSIQHNIPNVEDIKIDDTRSEVFYGSNNSTYSINTTTAWHSYVNSTNIIVNATSNQTTTYGKFVLRYTKISDTPNSPVKLIGGEGKEGKSAYEVWLDNGNFGSEDDFLNSLKGQDGNVEFNLLTETQKDQLRGIQGPKGLGFDIKKAFPNTNSMIQSLQTEIYEDADIVYVENELSFDYINKINFYISPTGDDNIGDGTKNNPWKTLKRCPEFSVIGLLPGVYSDAVDKYGLAVAVAGYSSIHGLFKDAFTQPVSTSFEKYILDRTIRNINTTWSQLQDTNYFTYLVAVEGPDTVTIEMNNKSTLRDYPFHSINKNIFYKDLTISADRGKTTNYSSSWTSAPFAYIGYLNCKFMETKYYSLVYNNNGGATVLYLNSSFTGTKSSNYSGTALEDTNIVYDSSLIMTDIKDFYTPAQLFIYSEEVNNFRHFIDTSNLLTMRGPKGQDGTVKFENLTPEQINMLKNGPKGDKGDRGETGLPGPRGVGVPSGGNQGQVLSKLSDNSYDTVWINPPSTGVGGIKYIWSNELERTNQIGMKEDEQGVQQDNLIVYKYNGTVWEEYYKMSRSNYSEGNIPPTEPKLGDEWFDYADGTLYKRVSDGTNSLWMSLNTNVSNPSTNTEKIPLNNNIIIKVGDDEEFKTINSAIEYLSRKYYPIHQKNNVTATIELQAGFIMKEQVIMENVDLSWITLVGVDSETIIDHTFLTINNIGLSAFLGINSKMINIGQLFNMTGGAETTTYLFRRGIVVSQNSSLLIKPGAGVKNAGYNGLLIIDSSNVVANEAIFTGAGIQNILCMNSILSFKNGNASAGKNQGVYAHSGGKIIATGANARLGASTNANDFVVNYGGEIILDANSIGGTAIAVNSLSSRGIIYKM